MPPRVRRKQQPGGLHVWAPPEADLELFPDRGRSVLCRNVGFSFRSHAHEPAARDENTRGLMVTKKSPPPGSGSTGDPQQANRGRTGARAPIREPVPDPQQLGKYKIV